ncbi:MAG: cell division protein ZipA [Pseudomonadota bacterium]
MELREWLIILGLALVTLIVVDGVRRLKRQRRVPRLDEAGEATSPGNGTAPDTEEDSNWELPNGGARVVTSASNSTVKPKPKLQRQEHPGPSRVLAGWRSAAAEQSPDRAKKVGQSADSGVAASPETPSTAADASSSPVHRGEDVGVAKPGAATPDAPVDDGAEAAPRSEMAKSAEASPELQGDDVTSSAARGGHEVSATAESRARDDGAAESVPGRREPTLSALDGAGLDDAEPPRTAPEPLNADVADHDDSGRDEDERYRLVDLEGVGDSLKSGSRRMGASMQRFGSSVQNRLVKRRERKREAREEKARLAEEREAAAQADRKAQAEREAVAARRSQAEEARPSAGRTDDAYDPLFTPSRRETADELTPAASRDEVTEDDVVRTHPTLEKALRHDVSAERARNALSHADEVIVISVMSRDEEGFAGAALLDLMLACGLRYSSEMGIFHRFETEDDDSELQFSMVNVLKPGTFPIESMDDFTTPGITLLMPLPGAVDTAAAFEAMVETAMVIVRHLGGELKDENHSVMTAQTVGFARQRVQEFERRHRLNRCQVN